MYGAQPEEGVPQTLAGRLALRQTPPASLPRGGQLSFMEM